MSEERVLIKLQLKYPDVSLFQRRFAPYIGRYSMFLPTRNLKAMGSPVQFEFLLANQERVLFGEGVVVAVHHPSPQGAGGLGIRFTALSQKSLYLLEQIEMMHVAKSNLIPRVQPNQMIVIPDDYDPTQPKVVSPNVPVVGNAQPVATPPQNPQRRSVQQQPKKSAQARTIPAPQPFHDRADLPLYYGKEEDIPDEGPIIGIDLGTTNSCCAIVENNRPRVIPSRFGYNTIPSIVAYDERQNLLVGHPAKSQMMLNPQNTVYGSKRMVGRKFHSPIVQFVQDRFHYKIDETIGGDAGVLIDNKKFSLQEISALVLAEIKELAQSYLEQPVHRAVISVPAYYNDNQRQAVRKAGLLAGMRVQRIVNEPTAAALAYGFGRDLKQRLLVYDLGGGTFDASVLEIDKDVYEVISTGGNTFLGGVDLDERLIDYVVEHFYAQHGVNLRSNAVKMQRVKDAVEKAKCDLSSQPHSELHIPYIDIKDGKPLDIDMILKREQLETLVHDLIDETLRVCDEVLAAQNLSPSDIDEVILVGGQTRMPLVHQKLAKHFGKLPHRNVHPDEAVALGTAVLSHSIGREEHIRLVDVLAMSIGIGLPGGRFKTVVPRNTQMPFQKSYLISTTRDNQTELEIMIFQGEGQRVSDNAYLGTLRLQNIPAAPKGQMRFKINFKLSQEAILTVSSTDMQIGETQEVTLSTQDTPHDIREKLEISEEPAEQPSELPEAVKKKPAGKMLGWLKGLFHKK